MDSFFNYLSEAGTGALVFITILLVILLVGLIAIVYLIIKNVKIDYKGLKLEGNKSENNKNSDKTSKKDNKDDKIYPKEKTSVIATQDYRIISLIVQAHANRFANEIRSYCQHNGLNKKTKEEYSIYIDEKKNLYIAELKEMITHEYISYDLISLSELFAIVDKLSSNIMSTLEKLYIKLRDISIEEHKKLDQEEIEANELCIQALNIWNNTNFDNENDKSLSLGKIVNSYRERYKKVILHEHIDILNLQLQKINSTKKDLTFILINEVMNVIEEKQNNS